MRSARQGRSCQAEWRQRVSRSQHQAGARRPGRDGGSVGRPAPASRRPVGRRTAAPPCRASLARADAIDDERALADLGSDWRCSSSPTTLPDWIAEHRTGRICLDVYHNEKLHGDDIERIEVAPLKPPISWKTRCRSRAIDCYPRSHIAAVTPSRTSTWVKQLEDERVRDPKRHDLARRVVLDGGSRDVCALSARMAGRDHLPHTARQYRFTTGRRRLMVAVPAAGVGRARREVHGARRAGDRSRAGRAHDRFRRHHRRNTRRAGAGAADPTFCVQGRGRARVARSSARRSPATGCLPGRPSVPGLSPVHPLLSDGLDFVEQARAPKPSCCHF